MSECAFCFTKRDLTFEHITSAWMGRAFPSRKAFKRTDRFGNEIPWIGAGLDIKVKVICGPCNHLMSELIEKPAIIDILPLLQGRIAAPFGKQQARTLAQFAFEKTVVIDCAQEHREPFFSKRIRRAFKDHLFIPQALGMWMIPFAPSDFKRRFNFLSNVFEIQLEPGYDLSLYVVSFLFGALAFQVVAYKQIGLRSFAPLPSFENMVVPFWPNLLPGFEWPGPDCLRTGEEFHEFHERWARVRPV